MLTGNPGTTTGIANIDSTGEMKILFLHLPHIFLIIMKNWFLFLGFIALVALAIYIENHPSFPHLP